jgi:hypothetical protein
MEALPSILLLKEYISLSNEEQEEKQKQLKHRSIIRIAAGSNIESISNRWSSRRRSRRKE